MALNGRFVMLATPDAVKKRNWLHSCENSFRQVIDS